MGRLKSDILTRFETAHYSAPGQDAEKFLFCNPD
jgi:hypothetical protein